MTSKTHDLDTNNSTPPPSPAAAVESIRRLLALQGNQLDQSLLQLERRLHSEHADKLDGVHTAVTYYGQAIIEMMKATTAVAYAATLA